MTFRPNQGNSLSKRNPEIEFLRFAAAIAVCAFHYGVLKGGFLAVDFFFILSGVLLTKSLVYSENKDNNNIFNYQLRQIKGFYPELILAYAWSCLFALCVYGLNLTTTISLSINTIYDLLLLRMTGLFPTSLGCLTTSWFLSSLILSGSLAYFIISKIKNPFLLLFCACILLSYIIHKTGRLSTFDWITFTYSGNLRAVGELLIGSAVYHTAAHLKGNSTSFTVNLLRKIIKLLSLVGICLLFIFYSKNAEPYVLVFTALYLTMVFSDAPRQQSHHLFTKTCRILGRLSVSLFLTHDAVLNGIGGKILSCPFLIQHHLNHVLLIFLIIVCTLITAWLSNQIRNRFFKPEFLISRI